MTHQSDEKHLSKTIGHLAGWLIYHLIVTTGLSLSVINQ